MKIIIASTRAPKVNGVKKAVERLATLFSIDQNSILFEMLEASSGVSDTPLSIDELMCGARQRAQRVFQKRGNETVFSIGVEGGLFSVEGKVFLQSWTCVYNGEKYHYGSSGAIELPDALAAEVVQNGVDLGIAIDVFAKQADVRSNQGTFGILTNDCISREDSFELAAICAPIPFLNEGLYSQSGNTELTQA
jgi:inosine/xanthosine triphosphatase